MTYLLLGRIGEVFEQVGHEAGLLRIRWFRGYWCHLLSIYFLGAYLCWESVRLVM